MSPQLDYNDLAVAIEGGLADAGFHDSISRSPGANVAQVSTITVDTAVNSTAYQFVVNGVPINFTSDASATIAEIHAGLLAAAQGSAFLKNVVTFAGASPNITITADVAGVPFTVTESDANLSLVATTANVTGNPIRFGRGLAEGLSQNLAALPSATGFLFAGVSVQKQKSQANANDIAQYVSGEAVSVLRKGRIWVLAEQIITAISDPVFLRHTTNAGTTAQGRFRKDADTARADQITNARWLTVTSAADQLAILEVNLP